MVILTLSFFRMSGDSPLVNYEEDDATDSDSCYEKPSLPECASSEAKASADSVQGSQTKFSLYSEQQGQNNQCGVHALNMLVGKPVFTITSLTETASRLVEANTALSVDGNPVVSMSELRSEQGDYALELLRRALIEKEYMCEHLTDADAVAASENPLDDKTVGFLEHTGKYHWIVIKNDLQRKQLCVLDSLGSIQDISTDDFRKKLVDPTRTLFRITIAGASNSSSSVSEKVAEAAAAASAALLATMQGSSSSNSRSSNSAVDEKAIKNRNAESINPESEQPEDDLPEILTSESSLSAPSEVSSAI